MEKAVNMRLGLKSRFASVLLLAVIAATTVTAAAQSSPTTGSVSGTTTGGAHRSGTHAPGMRIDPRPNSNAQAETRESDASKAGATALIGSNAQDYVITENDVLEVYILDVGELSRQYRVSQDGTVSIPLLKQPTPAAGLTLQRFAETLERDLKAAGLVSTPHVSVSVRESPAHAVAVTGAVKNAHDYPVFARTTLLSILSDAGGLAENAGPIALITRSPSNADHGQAQQQSGTTSGETLTVDLKKLMQTGDPRLNIPIFPGDTITVPPGGIVYVVGAVNKPGGFVISTEQDNVTVLQALALAEDIKPTAARDKAMIVRRGKESNADNSSNPAREQIPVKLSQVLAGKAPDVALQPNDILFIPDSSSKRAFRRGAEAAVQMATGLAIWARP